MAATADRAGRRRPYSLYGALGLFSNANPVPGEQRFVSWPAASAPPGRYHLSLLPGLFEGNYLHPVARGIGLYIMPLHPCATSPSLGRTPSDGEEPRPHFAVFLQGAYHRLLSPAAMVIIIALRRPF